jgi:hypothetical protein
VSAVSKRLRGKWVRRTRTYEKEGGFAEPETLRGEWFYGVIKAETGVGSALSEMSKNTVLEHYVVIYVKSNCLYCPVERFYRHDDESSRFKIKYISFSASLQGKIFYQKLVTKSSY